jgi:hypothetical protein
MISKRNIIFILISLFVPVVLLTLVFYFISNVHVYEKYKIVQATEKEYGYSLNICKHCGRVKFDDYVEPTSYKLNTLPAGITNSKWTGKYYTDYEMNVTAIAKEGYSFAGWKIEGAEIVGDKNSPTISVKLIDNQDCIIDAIFERK